VKQTYQFVRVIGNFSRYFGHLTEVGIDDSDLRATLCWPIELILQQCLIAFREEYLDLASFYAAIIPRGVLAKGPPVAGRSHFWTISLQPPQ
jgi:hypothetical protein